MQVSRGTTAQRNALTVGASDRIAYYNTDRSRLEIYTGSLWDTAITENGTEVNVTSLSDLPTPVAGVITLTDNVTYRIKGLVAIGTNRIEFGVSNTIVGVDKSNDGFLYTGTGSLFSCTNRTLSIVNIIMVAPSGTFFNFTNTTAFSIQVRDCITAQGNLGTINGGDIVAFNNNVVSPLSGSGLVFTGTFDKIAIASNFFENVSANEQVYFNSATCDIIKIVDNDFETNVVGIRVETTTITSNGGGSIVSNGFSGTGSPIVGIDTDTELWILAGNGDKVTSTVLGLSPNTLGVFRDDFETGGNETGEIGTIGWQFTNGTVTTPINAGEVNRTGIIQRQSSNINGQVNSMYMGRLTNTPTTAYQNIDEFFWIVRPLNTLTNFRVAFGVSADWGSEAPTHAVYFRKHESFGTWRAVTRNGGLETDINTGVTVVANTWYKLHAKKIATGVEFRINGVLVGTSTTTIPDNADLLHFGNFIRPNLNAVQSVDIDFFSGKTKTTGR
jgi:hypothetical protein